MIHVLGDIEKGVLEMENKNYTKFSQHFKNKEHSNEVMAGQVTVDELITAGQVTVDEIITGEPVTEVSHEVENTPVIVGAVTGCKKLNVRKEASKESDILCVINENEEVTLHTEETENFYKVTTSSGVEGYCMKKFVTVK